MCVAQVGKGESVRTPATNQSNYVIIIHVFPFARLDIQLS